MFINDLNSKELGVFIVYMMSRICKFVSDN